MSLFISSLNSGSNGNCYYIGNDQEAVLIDAGISCREIEKRLKKLLLDILKIKAVFISHEHTDHISGVAVLSKKYQLPVYITAETQKSGRLRLEKHLIKRFVSDEPVKIGQLTVIPFFKEHDAEDPHSFVISSANTRVGVFTDIGIACKQVIHYFKQCHAVFLEANYDEDMLLNGSYPKVLKKRISNGKGHLSNLQAFELYKKHRSSFLSHLILSHLSKNNNRPDLVNELFLQYADGRTIIVASRDEETSVYHIDSKEIIGDVVLKKKYVKPEQLSLF